MANQTVATEGDSYTLYAKFDNIGGLKPRSAVKVGGVTVGRVSSITLDQEDFTPVVELSILKEYNGFPETSSVSILTSGLLGNNMLGFSTVSLSMVWRIYKMVITSKILSQHWY